MKKLVYLAGNALRETGQALDRVGCQLQGNFAYKEQLSRHRRIMPLFDKRPAIAPGAWIAPNASVIGRVELGEKSSIWYGAVLRGDVNNIKIGNLSTIGDRSIIHVSSGEPKGALPTIVGNKVTVEHGVILHACTLEDECRVETGATILDGVVVGKQSIVGAGSLVSAGKKIPSGELWSGVPAKFVRKLTPEEIQSISKSAEDSHLLATKHDAELVKTEEKRQSERDYDEYYEEVKEDVHKY